MMRRLWKACLPFVLTLGCASCGTKVDPGGTGAACDTAKAVTYAADIAPLMEEHCVRCHSSDLSGSARQAAPIDVNLNSYAGLTAKRGKSTVAAESNAQIRSGSMPNDDPGGLPALDRCVFDTWVSQGTPEQ